MSKSYKFEDNEYQYIDKEPIYLDNGGACRYAIIVGDKYHASGKYWFVKGCQPLYKLYWHPEFGEVLKSNPCLISEVGVWSRSNGGEIVKLHKNEPKPIM